MKILYISQYFHPEVGATTNRALANIRHLVARGHDVTVLTEMPNHPQGIIRKEYRNKLFLSEKMESFLVKRFWVFATPKKTLYSRILFYLSFAFFASIYILLHLRKYDVVFITSPPLPVAIPGLIGKILYPRKRIVFEVRDPWPDVAIDMNELRNPLVIRLSYALERKIYQKATKIITTNKNQKKTIVSKGPFDEKVEVIPNGVDMSHIKKGRDQEVPFMVSEKKKGNFIITYGGILGIAYSWDTVLETAAVLQDEKVLFVIVGSGPKEAELHSLVAKLKISNIIFTGEVPTEEFHRYVLTADCSLIPLRKNIATFENLLPAKFFYYLAIGTPILLGIEGDAARILDNLKAGIYFKPEDSTDLRDKILYLRDNPTLLESMRGKGEDYVFQHYNRDKLAERLEQVILQATDSNLSSHQSPENESSG